MRAHGLRGEVILDMTSDRPERVSPGAGVRTAQAFPALR